MLKIPKHLSEFARTPSACAQVGPRQTDRSAPVVRKRAALVRRVNQIIKGVSVLTDHANSRADLTKPAVT